MLNRIIPVRSTGLRFLMLHEMLNDPISCYGSFLYCPKYQKIRGFLLFSEGIERDQCNEIGQIVKRQSWHDILKAMAKRIILFSAILRMNIKGFKYFVISLPSRVIRVVLFKPFLIFPGYLYVVISKYPSWAFSKTIFRSFTLFAIVEDIEVVWLDNNWQVHRIDDPIFIRSGEVISLGFALFFYLLFKTLQFIHFIELPGVS